MQILLLVIICIATRIMPAYALEQKELYFGLSADTYELAKALNVKDLICEIKLLKEKVQTTHKVLTLENLALRQDLSEAKLKLNNIITKTSLEVETVRAQIAFETARQTQLQRMYEFRRDRSIARANALSFVTNGALWAVAESLEIPTNTHPNLSISTGTIGILAGIVPSMQALYALRLVSGKHYSRPAEPNILAKLFDYQVSPDIDYPDSIWKFLNSVPEKPIGFGSQSIYGETRKERLIDLWVHEKEIPKKNDKNWHTRVGILTGVEIPPHSITIAIVDKRLAMLEQLDAVVARVNNCLLEIMHVTQ